MCDFERICGLVIVFIVLIIVKVKYDTIFCVGCYKGYLMMMYFFWIGIKLLLLYVIY